MLSMKPHLVLAHHFWSEVVEPGDTVIDATCGNGHDTLYLSSLVGKTGRVIGYDIQPEAIAATKRRLEGAAELKLLSHEQFEEPHATLIVYNLGYLPGANKRVTTAAKTTLQSVHHALQIASRAISILCYPGHEEGMHEAEQLLAWISSLKETYWDVSLHRWPLKRHSPFLIWLTKQTPPPS